MKLVAIRFDGDHIYGIDSTGKEFKQSLLWYPKLHNATDEERGAYTIGIDGIHWRNIDEDISFESFEYEDAEPTTIQLFFLTHRDVDTAAFAHSAGISPSELRRYINGFAKPSRKCEADIIACIDKMHGNAINKRI